MGWVKPSTCLNSNLEGLLSRNSKVHALWTFGMQHVSSLEGPCFSNWVGKTKLYTSKSCFGSWWSQESWICVLFLLPGEFCCLHDSHPAANGWQPLHPLYQHIQNQTRYHRKLFSLGPGSLKNFYVWQKKKVNKTEHPESRVLSSSVSNAVWLSIMTMKRKMLILTSLCDRIWRRVKYVYQEVFTQPPKSLGFKRALI